MVLPRLVILNGHSLLWRSKRYVRIGSDNIGDLLDTGLYGGAELTLLKLRIHAAANISHLCVGKNAFESVADFDAVLLILDGENEKDALVGRLRADLPGVFQGRCPGIDVLAVQRSDRDNLDSGVGLRVDLPSNIFDVFFGSWIDDVSEVADVACGFRQLVGRLCMSKADESTPEKTGPDENAFCSHNDMVRLKGCSGSIRGKASLMRGGLRRLTLPLGQFGAKAIRHVSVSSYNALAVHHGRLELHVSRGLCLFIE